MLDKSDADLDDPDWAKLRHAGGSAFQYPSVIRKVTSLIESNGMPDDELLEDMWDICHQMTTYDATLAAIPYLVANCATALPSQQIRKTLLDLIGFSVACIRSDGTTSTPEIVSAFDASISILADLALQTLPHATGRTELSRLFGAFAVAKGDYGFGAMLYELPHGSLQCKSCHEFQSPFESSLNPLWDG